jgi:endonuclease G, mitochondrial
MPSTTINRFSTMQIKKRAALKWLVFCFIFADMRSFSLSLLLSMISLLSYSEDSIPYAVQKAIFKDMETERIAYIQQLIDSVGMAAPVKGEQVARHSGFTSSYNTTHRIPNYVVHVIPKDILYGNQTRTNDFRPDPKIKQNMSDSADYWMSGYDRGHMAPSADFKWSKKVLSESYYYSNIIPQNKELNQGAWNKMEMLIREWAIENNEVIVVTGPVLKPDLPKLQQGSFQVSIPEQLFKIVLDYYPPQYKAIAFLFPNKNVPFKLDQHAVSIDSIETLTGMDFFPELADSIEQAVEKQADIIAWDKNFSATDAVPAAPLRDYGKGKISAAAAKDFIGKEACVCGKVVSTKFVENGKSNPTYINLEKKFPDQIFTVIVYGNDRFNFSYKPEEYLQGKTICVRGKVGEFKGIPQIIAGKEKQVEILPE